MMLTLFTILHPLVDACSVTVLVVVGMSWQRVLAYSALAFALQFPLGVALDARPRLVKGTFVASLALTLLGVGLCACGAGDGALGTTRPTEWMALVTAVSVVGSLSLCFLCRPEQAALWLAFLFVAQLATGPVLSLMHDKSGKASGTAFGLNCLALFTGSL